MLVSIVVQTPTGALSYSATYFQGILEDTVAIASSMTILLAVPLYKSRLILLTATTRIQEQITKIEVRATQFLSSRKLTIIVVVQQGG
jgi:hypothetical protein